MTTRTSEPLTAEFLDLISSVRRAVGDGADSAVTARRVGEALSERLSAGLPVPDHLRRHDPDHYTQHIAHVEPGGVFSIVVLVWLPGQATAIHDHVSWCVTGVLEGQETEEVYELRETDGRTCLVRTGESVNVSGAVSVLDPPGDIHRVHNSCSELAVSLHIYGADIHKLGSSIRRTYDLPVVERAG
ncbi:cysteine dioxygenase family protein [Saccharomonospora glauca]|uniref:Putative metal-dependent enzyme of the double-stranded beta helix superfamily n=1 Tax=Saccharomonospora glauca K62 TaxID=928724 RepID=I1D1V1_9PSEU|nr:cysteine dioxygenase family protein [Saccharomonospora glauca]EIE98925.1 putative metal-dependent enzyme of the double-stranded beta helix superfamily [Saccharomonospora glauca K62]